MLESIYHSQIIIDEIDRSPYGPFVRRLVGNSLRDGFKPENVGRACTLIVRFIRWAAHFGYRPQDLRAKHFHEFLASVKKPGKNGSTPRERRHLERLMLLIEVKYRFKLVEKPMPPYARNPGVVRAMADFEVYMRDVRGLSPTSIVRFRTTIGQFLTFRFSQGHVKLRQIEAKDVLNFLRARGARYQDKTLRCDGSALRCYFRYIYGKRLTRHDLSHAVPQIACWRNQNVVHTVTEEEMALMLRSCSTDTPVGVRDYAILLVLMRYGLRPIEVSRLQLEDILWAEKKIAIRGKGRKNTHLPLEPDIANALDRYIGTARPLSKSKSVFLRSHAPFGPMAVSAAISSIVRRAILRADLHPEIFGARLLRYSVASKILNSGGNLKEVAELFRHTSIDTSARYMRLDLRRLSLVALPWPEKSKHS
jgi:site-specific recombinase XerD